MNINLNLTHNLNQLLSNLKLPICLKDYLEVAARCEKEKLSHIEFFYEILQRESDYRMQKKIDKLVKSAQLPRDKLLSDFDMTRIPGLAPSQIIQLAEGEFIDRYGNVLIFGNPRARKNPLKYRACTGMVLGRKTRLFLHSSESCPAAAASEAGIEVRAVHQKIRPI